MDHTSRLPHRHRHVSHHAHPHPHPYHCSNHEQVRPSSSSSNSHSHTQAHDSTPLSNSSLPASAVSVPPIPVPSVPHFDAASSSKKMNNFDVWIMDTLIRLYVKPGQRIGEFFCGNGIGMSRLMVDLLSPPMNSSIGSNPFKIGSYFGCDGDTSSAKNRWITKEMPFPANFVDCELTQSPTSASTATTSAEASLESSSSPSSPAHSTQPILPRSSLDLIFSFKSLSRHCGTLSALRGFLHNISHSLVEGGLFIATIVDPAVIWYKMTKREREGGGKEKEKEGKSDRGLAYFGPGYKLDFPHIRPLARSTSLSSSSKREKDNFNTNDSFRSFTPDMKFYFQLIDSLPSKVKENKHFPPMSSFLIRSNDLVEQARSFGLEIVQMTNCMDLYTDLSSLHLLAQTFHRLNLFTKESPNQLTQAQADLFSLFMIVVFKKIQ